jgi:hypothetical protein
LTSIFHTSASRFLIQLIELCFFSGRQPQASLPITLARYEFLGFEGVSDRPVEGLALAVPELLGVIVRPGLLGDASVLASADEVVFDRAYYRAVRERAEVFARFVDRFDRRFLG